MNVWVASTEYTSAVIKVNLSFMTKVKYIFFLRNIFFSFFLSFLLARFCRESCTVVYLMALKHLDNQSNRKE